MRAVLVFIAAGILAAAPIRAEQKAQESEKAQVVSPAPSESAVISIISPTESSATTPTAAKSSDEASVQALSSPWQKRATAKMLQGRSSNSAVWTGKELIVFGGEGMNVSFGNGARYGLGKNRWRPLTQAGEPSERTDHSGIWTGREMIIWGGFGGSYGNNTNRNDGARYDPKTQTWRPMTTRDAPSPRFLHSAIWTGKEMIIWGGYTDSHALYAGAHADAHMGNGSRYFPDADSWKEISNQGAPSKRFGNAAIWTGKEMIIWGGCDAANVLGDGARYDPWTDTWKPMTTAGAPSPRTWPVAVWTGKEMIVWGGGKDKDCFRDGARYDPRTDRWTPISTDNAPRGRTQTKAFWTGKDMIVWGGVNDEDVTGVNDTGRYLNTGGRYNPFTDKWTPMTTTGAPSGRLASQVWTGNGLLIFGGYNNTHLNDTWFYKE